MKIVNNPPYDFAIFILLFILFTIFNFDFYS